MQPFFRNEAEALEWYRSLKSTNKIGFDAWLVRNDMRLLKFLFWRVFVRFFRRNDKIA